MRLTYQAEPSTALSTQEADRHHELLHSPEARSQLLRGGVVRRYAWDRARATLGIDGTLRQRPTAWKFINLDLPAKWAPGDGIGVSAAEGSAVVNDHRNFLRNLRTFHSRPDIIADRRSGQLTTAKILIVSDHAPERARVESEADHRALRDAIADQIRDGRGRLLVSAPVSTEFAAIDGNEPAQFPGGPVVAATLRLAHDEVYCDNALEAEELLATSGVRDALRAFQPGQVAVHLVREWVGLDRAEPQTSKEISTMSVTASA